jgi:hypothetical protein
VLLSQIHIVSFDGNGKIVQMRQNWDQGSLLKLIDVIGKTGRNWPIRDGKDQIKLIASSVKSAGKPVIESRPTHRQDDIINRSRENSTNVTRDPHASLSLFAPRDQIEQDSQPAVIAPRASAKPPPRDYHDLFVGNDDPPAAPAPKSNVLRERSESPSKFSAGIAPKVGAGKNFQPSRIFDTEENPVSPEKSFPADHLYRPNPKKYQHFDFADGSDPQDSPKPAPVDKVKSKHGSQWNFDDFNTPAKVIPTKVLRGQDVRHWGAEEDEVQESPVRQKKVDKPRKDAETHFEFQDDGTPEGVRLIGRPRGAGHNTGLGLYENHLFDEDDKAPAKAEPRVLGNIANIKDRRKDFDPHFTMTDDSPSTKETKQPEKLPEDKMKAVKTMEASWSAYDQSPSASSQKENAGPGPASPTRPGTGKGPLSESTNTMSHRNDNPTGIVIGGDGMGGKKGTGRSWGFGDESDGEEAGGLNGVGGQFRKGMPGKKQGTAMQTGGGDFWDF